MKQFAFELLLAAKTSAEDATAVAEALVWADARSRHPQGVGRLPMLVRRVQRGLISSPALMTWTRCSTVAYHLDAGNGFGHVAGRRAIERAVELAKAHGVGIITVRRSNLYCSASTILYGAAS